MKIGGHSGFVRDGSFYFGGHSDGFKTKFNFMAPTGYNQFETDLAYMTNDAYLFKYDPYGSNSCFYHD